MYGMMPRAKMVSRRMLPPANRSKNPKIEPCVELKNSCQRWMLMPGVGIWLPSRYTASSPSVNSSRLRRSGMRKMLREGFKKLHGSFSDSRRHFRRSAPITCAVPPAFSIFSSADFENRCASTVILRVNWPVPRTFSPSPSFLIDAQLQQPVRGEAVAFQLLQPAQVDDGVTAS